MSAVTECVNVARVSVTVVVVAPVKSAAVDSSMAYSVAFADVAQVTSYDVPVATLAGTVRTGIVGVLHVCTGTATWTLAVALAPLGEIWAVMVALPTATPVTLKFAELVPWLIVTDDGTVAMEVFEEERLMVVALPTGALALTV